MFTKNNDHLQYSFYNIDDMLGDAQKKAFLESKERWFYELIFKKIDESIFEPLYSAKKSRPNAPINSMVSSLILQSTSRWSYEFLMRQIHFDLLTRKAIGLTSLDEVPFCEATLFNFQNKLLQYEIETGENLIEKIFDGLTKEQLETLKIKTDIQRCDSLQVESNIRSYSRIQLLIEVLLRVYRILSDGDKKLYATVFAPYMGKTSGQYVYKVEHDNIDKELKQVAHVFGTLKEVLAKNYFETDIARIFARVFEEHFTIASEKIEVKPSSELHSGCLQSPDDEDATYRKKQGIGYHGNILTATETCNPANELQLITDVHVTSNNRDDSEELNDRLEGIKEKTPDIDTLHTDGGYGSEKNDVKMKALGIEQVQTAIRGRECAVDISIKKDESDAYQVTCPLQTAQIHQTKKKLKAVMNAEVCETCPLHESCPSLVRKTCRVLYFDDQDVLRQKRQGNILSLPVAMRKLRANVEATMREFSRRTECGKLKVRGIFKAQLFGLTTAIGINFGRVYRHVQN